ncbi:sensor histidine kinase [Nocardioides abyssi]|uniref:Sensor histidine kinase n=1 Tax=Nocardioides abyssi TaxID=3058370 RepID=A0ABT8EZM3_9ACTN|nr:sensor histidine kinase [Nocardioides abyssi]MDN4163488.1 sensor histidine kinase [Nocardioides abyssi]
MTLPDLPFARLTLAARGFVLLFLSIAAVAQRDEDMALALIAIGATWVVVQLAEFRPGVSTGFATTFDAVVVGLVCGITVGDTLPVLAALAVPPFTAGLYRGAVGVALAMSAQLVALLGVVVLAYDGLGGLDREQSIGIFTWVVTGLGLGLIATFLHSAIVRSVDPLAPYHYAQTLLRQLIDLSGGLKSGLDPTALGGAIVSSVRDELPVASLVLYVPRGESLTPLVEENLEGAAGEHEDVAAEAWARGEVVVQGQSFAIPLDDAAVVAGVLSDRLDPGRLDLTGRIRRLQRRLAPSAVHLDTALLFSSFRDAATAEERRRLAREMHDGVAQEIASLGYLVDALAAQPGSPEQADRIALLRDRVSHVVGEVRQSVLTLRTSVGENESLGAAISSIARHLSEVAGVPIQVTLEEHTTRLRPEVEAELFRITQEAMNNAIKHAQATVIDVHCRVHAPRAIITVSDDGRGMQQARSDSHGLEIMQERATLIGGRLSIDPAPDGGLVVTVAVGTDLEPPVPGVEAPDDKKVKA